MQSHQQRQIQTFRQPGKVNIDDVFCDVELAQHRARLDKLNRDHSGRIICDCPETLMPDGSRLALHRITDCEYSKARSARVEQAATLADKAASGNGAKSSWRSSNNWMKHFVA